MYIYDLKCGLLAEKRTANTTSFFVPEMARHGLPWRPRHAARIC